MQHLLPVSQEDKHLCSNSCWSLNQFTAESTVTLEDLELIDQGMILLTTYTSVLNVHLVINYIFFMVVVVV